MTADDLGRAVGVTKETVYRWRAGNFPPEPDRWAVIAQALEISYNDIAKLLINVRLLGPRAQDIAERLDSLPDDIQPEAARAIHALLDRYSAPDSKHKVSYCPVVAA